MLQHYLTANGGLVVIYPRRRVASYSYPTSDNADRYARLKTPAARYRFARELAAKALRSSRWLPPQLVADYFARVSTIPRG